MTSDFDELASAYLDGEATGADAARVESDPELRAVVEELRVVADALDAEVAPADELLRGRQIATALDAFDELLTAKAGSAGATGPAATAGAAERQVADVAADPLDFDRRRADRDRRRDRPGGLPRWLSVAAVLLLVVGGVGLLAQLGGSDDDAETATEAFETSDEAATATTVGADRAADGGDDAGTPAAQLADAEARSADEDDTAESEAAEEEAEADDGADADAAVEDDTVADDEAAEGDTSPEATVAAGTGGFFPEEQLEAATAAFDSVPDQASLLALADGPRFDPALAVCASTIEREGDGDRVRFFVPVTVDGVDGEALFVGSEADPVAILVDGDCQPLS